jgi:hypothetical protein
MRAFLAELPEVAELVFLLFCANNLTSIRDRNPIPNFNHLTALLDLSLHSDGVPLWTTALA